MTDSKASSAKQKSDSEHSPQDKTKSAQKPAGKKNRIPQFKEEDMYKVKYDF
ncbi:MAG: hypothetical protein AAFY50_16835 [Cyanobacteria bacterium J06648_1]